MSIILIESWYIEIAEESNIFSNKESIISIRLFLDTGDFPLNFQENESEKSITQCRWLDTQILR